MESQKPEYVKECPFCGADTTKDERWLKSGDCWNCGKALPMSHVAKKKDAA